MIKIAICDDEKRSTETLENYIKMYGASHSISFECDIFLSGEELLKTDTSMYAVLFLDVEMGSSNGIEIARTLRINNKDTILVYVSGILKYAPFGYGVNAFRYILKSDIEANFKSTMDDVVEKLNLVKNTFAMDLEDGKKEIPIKNISFIEAFKRKVIIHTINWEQEQYEFYAKLSDLSQELVEKGFIRIHKSYLVNMQCIAKLKGHEVYLKNNTALKASDRSWQDIIIAYTKWKGDM